VKSAQILIIPQTVRGSSESILMQFAPISSGFCHIFLLQIGSGGGFWHQRFSLWSTQWFFSGYIEFSYHLLILLAISIISPPDAESALDKIYYMEYEHPAARSDQISEASQVYSSVALTCILMHLQQLK
jgi:hypothetical protein